ncbi:MAG: FG-GAP repeat protein [Scytolyngbya sp. HA4215-MV1]|nr:FG-GAP repeat protein [Scytolyngbya sp. HA4215-MV1]
MLNRQTLSTLTQNSGGSVLDPNSNSSLLGSRSHRLEDDFRLQSASSSSVSSKGLAQAAIAPPPPLAASTAASTTSKYASSDVIADFNKDGYADVVWRNYSTSGAEAGKVVIWSMNGTTPTGSYTLPVAVIDPNWRIEGTGDFNGDGWSDIVWRYYGSNSADLGKIVVWTMNGFTPTGSVQVPFSVTDTNWSISGTGDFNRDSNADILWRNNVTGENTIWVMNRFTPVSSVSLPTITDTNWSTVGTGDFTRDGQVDILWRNAVTGENTLWRMSGTTAVASTAIASVTDTNWYIGGIGDFNQDGQADIFWHRHGSGENTIWRMDGTTPVLGTSVAPSVTGTDWRVGLRILNSGSPTPTGKADLQGTYFDVLLEPLFSGDFFTVDVDVSNVGTKSTNQSFRVSFYLSYNDTISTSDYFLGSTTIGALNTGGVASLNYGLSLPGFTSSFWAGSGTYYIGMVVDSGKDIDESNESNNSSRGNLLDYDSVFITV